MTMGIKKMTILVSRKSKNALNATPVNITCYDRDGNVTKR